MQSCIWPLAWSNKHKLYNSLTLLQKFFTFHSPVKEKGKQWRMKGLTKAQWINLNQNNRSVLTHQYSVLWEKTGPILPSLVNLTAGREAGQQTKCRWVSNFLKFFNYLGFYYHSNVTTELELHFSQLLSSKAYFNVCIFKSEKFGNHFFQSLLLGTNVPIMIPKLGGPKGSIL